MKTIPIISRFLLAASFSAAITTHANGDPFVGKSSPIVIFDGDVELLYKHDFEPIKNSSLNITKTESDRYTVKIKAGTNSASIPTKRKGNFLKTFTRPVNMGGWKLHDFVMASDGTHRGFFMIGQDAPNDINCAMALWSESEGKVSTNDFVGNWTSTTYGDDNLINTQDGFELRKIAFKIRKLDSNHIQVMPPDGSALTLRVSGGDASLQSPPVKTASARFHSFRILTDGSKMVFSVVASERDNPTDVSATIGLGTKTIAKIAVQQPAGTQHVDGTPKTSFGTQTLGSAGKSRTFTIKNAGEETLTGLKITTNGAQANDFIATAPLAATLAPGEATTFKITFKPTAVGTRNAAIDILSNDKDENPFDIKLTGMGAK